MPPKTPSKVDVPVANAKSQKDKISKHKESVVAKKGPVNPPPLPVRDAISKVVKAAKKVPAAIGKKAK